MASKISKVDLPAAAGRVHKDKKLPPELLRFSFRHFVVTTKFCIPDGKSNPNYFETFLDRFKNVSSMTVAEFRSGKSSSLRAHKHDWPATTEINGYAHLSSQMQQCEPWQFCLSANEHGRVHGLLIGDVFHVVWIDQKHALYP